MSLARKKREICKINSLELSGKLISGVELTGLCQSIEESAIISINGVYASVFFGSYTNTIGLLELKRNQYIHFKGKIKYFPGRCAEDKDEFMIQCTEIIFVGNFDNFYEYEQGLSS